MNYIQGLAPFTHKRCPAKFIAFWWVGKEWAQKFWGYSEIWLPLQNTAANGLWLTGWKLSINWYLSNYYELHKGGGMFILYSIIKAVFHTLWANEKLYTFYFVSEAEE